MTISQLQVYNLRNLKSLKLDFHPKMNVITGVNGSGKTALLEALYLLGSGHSFRTREISPLVTHGEKDLVVYAKMLDEQTISIQKALLLPTQVLLNSRACQTSSELAYILPCQVCYQDIFQIIDAGPAVRRCLLNWGLFHVKHNYLPLWKDYRRALKQRNNLLRQRAEPQQLLPWDAILSALAEQLDGIRKEYFLQLKEFFVITLKQLSSLKCSLHYYKGWDKKEQGKSLASILKDNYQSDLSRQFTQYGPHQADLLLNGENFTVRNYLSRGQQKIILIALKFAQAKLMAKNCIFLLDDISAELDERHIARISELIKQTPGQFFITTINANSFPIAVEHGKLINLEEMFHVKHEIHSAASAGSTILE